MMFRHADAHHFPDSPFNSHPSFCPLVAHHADSSSHPVIPPDFRHVQQSFYTQHQPMSKHTMPLPAPPNQPWSKITYVWIAYQFICIINHQLIFNITMNWRCPQDNSSQHSPRTRSTTAIGLYFGWLRNIFHLRLLTLGIVDFDHHKHICLYTAGMLHSMRWCWVHTCI